jgi:uncharacterized protein (TIGR02594 family)
LRLLTIGFALTMSACTVTATDSTSTASEYLGLQERQHRSEIRELVGVDPVRTEWCAAFVNAILEIDNIPSLNDINHPHPLTARGFLQWGMPVAKNDIQRGDIVVFPRGTQGWQGHVGFYVMTTQEGYWMILGGNQDKSVKYSLYNPRRAISVRRWPQGTVQ